MDSAWEKVREFHVAFGAPHRDAPELLPPDRIAARAEWMREEIDELLEAETIAEQADAMIDLIYFALGTLVEMGVRPQPLFDIVQEANMSKLWPDGKPHYREDGKVIKSPHWADPGPKLEAEVTRQSDGATSHSGT